MYLNRQFLLIRGHTIFAPALNSSSVVVDAGAHRFEFARSLRDRFNCSVISLEPNASLLSPESSAITCLRKALSNESGKAFFELRENPEASALSKTQSQSSKKTEVDTISIPDLMAEYGLSRIDLLKLDIEGAECDVLLSLDPETLQKVGQITCEFHDFADPHLAIPVKNAIRHLQAAGFHSIRASLRTNGDYLFLNRSMLGTGSIFLRRLTVPLGRKLENLLRH